MNNNETFGQKYQKIQQQESGHAQVSEVRQGLVNEKDWDENMYDLIIKTRKIIPKDKFYIDVCQKREGIEAINKTIRNIFESKYSCPTPRPGHVVYRVEPNSMNATQLWVIPDLDTCIYLKKNANITNPKERQLVQWVCDLADGTLDKRAAKENGEIIVQS
jgi:hypothetical protein